MPSVLVKYRIPRTITLILLSLFLHCLFFIFIPMISTSVPDTSTPELFTIEKISNSQLQKIRMAGVKNGSKDFSQRLSLSQLSHATLISSKKTLTSKKVASDTVNVFSAKKMSPPPVTMPKKLPGKVGFDLQFSPPEGVPLDELNSVEKIFFSFYKRSFQTYASAVFRTLTHEIQIKPFIKKYLTGKERALTATVVFDEKGNILEVTNLQGSHNPHLLLLYREMLQSMNTIPNPPKQFIKSGKFQMHYKLLLGSD